MIHLIFTTGLLLGIIIGALSMQYLIPYFDTLFDMYQIKQAEIATEYNLNMEIMKCEVMRSYPELKENSAGSNYEQTNVIGFEYCPDEEDEYYEDDKFKNMDNKNIIGFKGDFN